MYVAIYITNLYTMYEYAFPCHFISLWHYFQLPNIYFTDVLLLLVDIFSSIVRPVSNITIISR